MTKRKGAAAEDTQEAILKCATKEFCEKGYEKASLRHICSMAGVTTGAVYCFFDGKEDLLVNVIKPILNIVNVISVEFEKILFNDYSDFDRFERFYSCNRDIYSILHNNRNNPVVFKYISCINDEFCSQISKMLRKVIPENKDIPSVFDDYMLNSFTDIMVFSIIKIIAEEEDDAVVKKRLITFVKIFRNGIISLIE